MRLFVTCDASGGTHVKLVDRVSVPSKQTLSASVAVIEEEFEFKTLQYSLTIETDSQPFIGDLNGDFLDDIMYTEAGSSSQILVALQLPAS